MSYLSDYISCMDYVRKRLGLKDDVSLYEAVVKLVAEFKQIEETLQKSQKEKKDAGRKPVSRNRSNTGTSS